LNGFFYTGLLLEIITIPVRENREPE